MHQLLELAKENATLKSECRARVSFCGA